MSQSRKRLRVGLSDESPFIIYTLQSILSAEFNHLEIYTYPPDTKNLLLRLREDTPDILITDSFFSFDRNDLNGVSKLEEIHKQSSDLKILVFTASRSLNFLKRVLQVPVSAVVSKRDDIQDLVKAVHWISSFHTSVYYSETMKDLAHLASYQPTQNLLSPSEMEVIRLFAMGHSLMEIAKVRSRSISTVATQKYNAMRKLHLSTNTELIKYVFAHELI